MENPGECSVCFTTYDDSELRPRTLPCGHTFCSPCIGNMMERGQLSCPTCRVHHPATSVIQFPINYAVEALVKQLKFMKLTQTSTKQEAPEATPAASGSKVTVLHHKKSTGISRKLQFLLEEQIGSVSSVMAGSQEVQSQLDQYRAQLADWKTQHLHLMDRLDDLVQQNKSALKLLEQEDTRVLDMKTKGEKGEKPLEAVLSSLQAVNTAREVFTVINHADHCTMEAEDWMQKCQDLFPDVHTIKKTMKVRETTRTALDVLTTEIGEEEGTRMTLETEGATAGATDAVFHQVDSTLSIMEKVKYITSQGEIKRDTNRAWRQRERMAEWREGRMAEWREGDRMAEWTEGDRTAEWKKGRMAEWRDGDRMAERSERR